VYRCGSDSCDGRVRRTPALPTNGDTRKEVVMATRSALVRPLFAFALLALASFAGSAGLAAPGASCSAESGAQTAALVELYTSEGCDSCPPADRWLSASFPPDKTEAGVIALAFHVDYWDRLGWKDRFASPAWTARQYALAHAARSSLVYTPQVLLQGRDFPDWRATPKAMAAVAAANARPARATIKVQAEPREGAIAVKATARVPGAADRGGTVLFVGLADSGLVSEVKAGENAGKKLRHDHVVRALRDGVPVDRNGSVAADVVLPFPAEAGTAATVVAFVQNVDSGDVLQALAVPVACAPAR